MLRIISGKHRGRKIESKEHAKIRPTGGRTRGAIFNILMHGEFHGEGSPLIDKRVVDVFCGTGALGLEALSRGAGHVTFIDQSAESMALVRGNVTSFGEAASVHFIRSDSTSLPPCSKGTCSLAFLDPPYGSNLATKSLGSLDRQGWLAPGAVAVVEMGEKDMFEVPEHYTMFDERKYGHTRIVFLRYEKNNP